MTPILNSALTTSEPLTAIFCARSATLLVSATTTSRTTGAVGREKPCGPVGALLLRDISRPDKRPALPPRLLFDDEERRARSASLRCIWPPAKRLLPSRSSLPLPGLSLRSRACLGLRLASPDAAAAGALASALGRVADAAAGAAGAGAGAGAGLTSFSRLRGSWMRGRIMPSSRVSIRWVTNGSSAAGADAGASATGVGAGGSSAWSALAAADSTAAWASACSCWRCCSSSARCCASC